MRLRTFNAHDMPTAMKLVRDALGDNAIILSTETKQGSGITLTAAVDMHDEPAKANGKSHTAAPIAPNANHLAFEIQNVLRFHNVPEHFVSKIVHKATDKEFVSLSALHHISANRDEKPLVRLVLEKVLSNYFNYKPLSSGDEPLRVILVGPPGIGKTLTVAKIATKLAMEKRRFAVFTTDNQRAGGVEQLQAFTDILELPLFVTPNQAEMANQIKALPKDSDIIIDTAGCNPYDSKEMLALKKLVAQSGVEPIMVLPAGGDSSETIDIVEAFSDFSIKRLLITRADTTRRFGSILSAAAAHKLAFCNISTSSSIVNSLEPMDGNVLAQMLLRYQLQSQ